MVIAISIMEYDFIALDKCGEGTKWLCHFLEDILGWPKPMPPICIHCDSQSVIGRAQNSMYKGKSKHIRRRHNTIKQLLSIGVISLDYVKSKDNIVDTQTKCSTLLRSDLIGGSEPVPGYSFNSFYLPFY